MSRVSGYALGHLPVFQAGKPKSIVVDIADVFRSDDHRLSIAISHQHYWDEGFVSADDDLSEVRQTDVIVQSAAGYRR